MTYDDLYPEQQTLFRLIEDRLAEGKPVIVEAGQRGGKTTIARALEAKLRPATFIAISHSKESAWTGYRTPLRSDINSAKRMGFGNRFLEQKFQALVNAGRLTENTLVVMDDAFWLSAKANVGEKIFKALAEHPVKLVAIGSRPPESRRWAESTGEVLRYATWDLNPTISKQWAYDNIGRHDMAAFERDFGAVNPCETSNGLKSLK